MSEASESSELSHESDNVPPPLVLLAKQVCDNLRERGLRLALAESCTGGLIAAAITEIPGASAVFDRGVVAYSNQTKIDFLTVPLVFLEQYGAVSEQTAAAMAEGALLISKADVAASVTGVAGPDGGTEHKPVGLVYVAFAEKRSGMQTAVRRFQFEGGRSAVRLQAAAATLEMIASLLLERTESAGRKDLREKAVV